MPFTVSQLFANAPSGVGPYGMIGGAVVGAVPQTPGSGTWLSVLFNAAATVQLPTTSWQPGDPERTILATEAVAFSLSDANISAMAQGGFLQSAAGGTVTWTSPSGVTTTTPVTPDPSNPAQNPTGAPGYEDLLAANVYGVTRLAATFVTGPLAIVKLSGGTLTYGVGAYHVQASLGGATYANKTGGLSIPPSGIPGTGGTINSVTPGALVTTIGTQSAHGLSIGQSVYVLLPSTAGITGLSNGPGGGRFAIVSNVPTTTSFQIAVGSSGTYTSGGTVYLCTVASMTADAQGIGSNAGPGSVRTTITQNAFVFVSNIVPWSGSNWESNLALAHRCQLSLAARSPNGPRDAYVYFAETAYQLLAEPPYNLPPPVLQNGPVTATSFSTPATGVVNLVVASSTPLSTVLGAAVTPGVSMLPISAVSNANPCVVTCTGPTSLSVGQSMTVTISGVLGALGTLVNGTFLATYTGANAFSIPVDTSAAASYTGGGSVEGGDLGQIDRLIQQNVVPDNTTAITSSALAFPIVVTATVVVPAANVTQYQAAVSIQLQAQIDSYSIGGDTVTSFEVSWNDIAGALEEAGVPALGQASYAHVQSLSVTDTSTTITASGQAIPFPSAFHKALLSNPNVTVVGV